MKRNGREREGKREREMICALWWIDDFNSLSILMNLFRSCGDYLPVKCSIIPSLHHYANLSRRVLICDCGVCQTIYFNSTYFFFLPFSIKLLFSFNVECSLLDCVLSLPPPFFHSVFFLNCSEWNNFALLFFLTGARMILVASWSHQWTRDDQCNL